MTRRTVDYIAPVTGPGMVPSGIAVARALEAVCRAWAHPDDPALEKAALQAAHGLTERFPRRAKQELWFAITMHEGRPCGGDPRPTLAGIREALLRF
jgi:hypothetical protein